MANSDVAKLVEYMICWSPQQPPPVCYLWIAQQLQKKKRNKNICEFPTLRNVNLVCGVPLENVGFLILLNKK